MIAGDDFRAVFEASPDATLIVDPEGIIRDLNEQAVQMFGWTREEMTGASVDKLVPEASRRRHVEHRERYAEAPRTRPMGAGLELLGLRRGGTTFPVEISLSPWTLSSGGRYTICAVRDITAWKRLRQRPALMIRAAENERKRLSHELHDDLLQRLVALKIQVKLRADEADEQKRERARAEIAREIDDTIQGVRRMVRGLRPPALEHHGLTFALAAHFRDLREVDGFVVDARLGPVDGELDATSTMALYRIVQEAVANVLRHAGVKEAAVTMELAGGLVVADITDDGCGFELPESGLAPSDGRIGITGMGERAAMVGGGVSVDSSPGKGTSVRVTIPVAGAKGTSEGGRREW